LPSSATSSPSLAAGASVVCPPGFDGPRFFAWLDEFRPTWYMAPPAVHRAVLDRAAGHAETIARVPLRFIRSGSAPLSPADEARLEATFGAPVTQGYGVTEASPSITAVPLAARDQESLARSASRRGRRSRSGVSGASSLPPGAVGEVVVRGPNVIRGYLDDPAADAKAFTADGWFRTGDLGSVDEDGFLFLAGRVKEVINRGGQKVAPQEVEAVLLAHPAVVEAVAFAVPDARVGEAVGAAVVLRPGLVVGEGGLRAFAGERLSAYKTPVRVVVVERLPTGPTGKPRRVGLAAELGLGRRPGQAARSAVANEPSRTALEARVTRVWSAVLGVDGIGAEDDFLALGGDSLLATKVVARLGAELGVDLAVAAFFDAPTVGGDGRRRRGRAAPRSGTGSGVGGRCLVTQVDPVAFGGGGPPGTHVATLPDVVRYWAERTPDAPAILAPGRSPLSYGALLVQIERTVRALNDAGLGRGDRVALALPDGPELAVAILAVAATATAAPLAPDAPPG
jgi:acyl-CoA synthetase (AMP-forming)/AMP-acid ligase II